MGINYGEIKIIPVMNSGTDTLAKAFANSILNLGDVAMLYGGTESETMLEVILGLGDDEMGLHGREGSMYLIVTNNFFNVHIHI